MVSVKATISRQEFVSVSERDLKHAAMESMSYEDATDVLIQAFKRKVGVRSDAFIEEGNWCYEYEYHGSHSWSETKVIRQATKEEIERYETLRALFAFEATE